jgi:hypothetical protein
LSPSAAEICPSDEIAFAGVIPHDDLTAKYVPLGAADSLGELLLYPPHKAVGHSDQRL